MSESTLPPENEATEPPRQWGGRREGAGRPRRNAADEKRRKASADKMAKLLFRAVENRQVRTGGDKWKADDEERAEIIDAGGDCIVELIDDYPAFLRLTIALGAYAGARVEAPDNVGGRIKAWWGKRKDDKAADSSNGGIGGGAAATGQQAAAAPGAG